MCALNFRSIYPVILSLEPHTPKSLCKKWILYQEVFSHIFMTHYIIFKFSENFGLLWRKKKLPEKKKKVDLC